MILSIPEGIEAVRNNIATLTNLNIKLGMPEDSDPGLYLFPYTFQEFPIVRDLKAPTIETEPQQHQAYNIKCLLVPNPSNDYTSLFKVHNSLNTNPLLVINETSLKIVVDNISTEDITRLFVSAGITYRLSIPIEISSSPL